MPRVPNSDTNAGYGDARGRWNLYEQSKAQYGEVWPVYVAPIPAWSGDRYFSYYGYNGGFVNAYEYCNSRTLATAWSNTGATGLFTSAYWAYSGKMSNGTRVVNANWWANQYGNVIEYITASTLGWSGYFGDAGVSVYASRGGSNGTLGIFAGGFNGSSNQSHKRYITIATTGNGSSYGNLYTGRARMASASGATYFTTFGGYGNTNWDYASFSSSSSSSNAGNLEGGGSPRYNYDNDAIDGGVGSSRIVMAGGAWQNGGHGDAMFHYTTASWGVGTDYANMANAREANSTTGDGTYGVIAGGQGQQSWMTGTLIFNTASLGAATVGANGLLSGVTQNGMGAGNQ